MIWAAILILVGYAIVVAWILVKGLILLLKVLWAIVAGFFGLWGLRVRG